MTRGRVPKLSFCSTLFWRDLVARGDLHDESCGWRAAWASQARELCGDCGGEERLAWLGDDGCCGCDGYGGQASGAESK